MKTKLFIRYLIWIFITVCFIILVQFGSSLEFFLLKDLKVVLILILATLLLLMLSYKNEQSVTIWRTSIQFNLFFVGAIMSALNLMSILGRIDQRSELMSIVFALKPLIYSLLLYLPIENILRSLTRNETIAEKRDLHESENGFILVESLDLSRREMEVIQLALQDLSNKQISERLFIQETTVKKHLQNIYKKTQCADRTELINKVKIK